MESEKTFGTLGTKLRVVPMPNRAHKSGSVIITRDDVVSQRLKFGSTFLRSQKWPCFFNFPVSRTRPEKIV